MFLDATLMLVVLEVCRKYHLVLDVLLVVLLFTKLVTLSVSSHDWTYSDVPSYFP